MIIKNEYTLPLDNERATLQNVGGKGAALTEMVLAGLPVPNGFHVTTAAYRLFVEENDLEPAIRVALDAVDPDRPATLEVASEQIRRQFTAAIPEDIAVAIQGAYAKLVAQSEHATRNTQYVPVAVRSSATAEDLPDASFAGQQDTYLNIEGAGAVLDAVKRCWASLWTARAIGYRVRRDIGLDGLSLAVVVQRLVPAEAAGILFTANPVNGRRTEAVINAAWGLGEAVVGGEVTPDTYTIDKETGEVLKREIAEKAVMTVRADGGTTNEPVPENLQRAPVLDDAQVAELVRLGVQIEDLYGDPRDIEWALADGKFAIVQARPITALPEPEAEPPTAWPLPDPRGKYSRASVVELLPDPLTPLFSTLGLDAINEGTKRMMVWLAGIKEGWLDQTVVTINNYAYYVANFPPKLGLRVAVALPSHMPSIIRNAEKRWRDDVHVRYIETIERWQAQPPEAWSAGELLTATRELMNMAMDMYTCYQSGLIMVANFSEILFNTVYERFIKRKDDPPALEYLLGADTTPIRAEKSLYDIAAWCRTHPALANYVASTSASQLARERQAQAPHDIEREDWQEWQSLWAAHLDMFGHIIYDFDFAKPLPADDPTALMDACKVFLNEQAPNPYERQQASLARREAITQAMLARLKKGLRFKLFRKLVSWAQKYTPFREEGLAELGLGYPLLRRLLLELGCRLVESGAISQADDIFWLYEAEAQQAAAALDAGQQPTNKIEAIEERKAIWRGQRRVTPPATLPPKAKWMGIDLDFFAPAESGNEGGTSLKGAGTCPGRVTATARVLHSPADFEQLQPGDIIVAKITTPAWTTIFSRAAAVVTDVGGALSHGSIVAREYGIPAVMGTGVATKCIESGQRITVDGDAGTVTLLES